MSVSLWLMVGLALQILRDIGGVNYNLEISDKKQATRRWRKKVLNGKKYSRSVYNVQFY